MSIGLIKQVLPNVDGIITLTMHYDGENQVFEWGDAKSVTVAASASFGEVVAAIEAEA